MQASSAATYKELMKKYLSFFIVCTVFAYLSYQIFLKKNELSQIDWAAVWLPILISFLLCMATQLFQVLPWYYLVRNKLTQPLKIKPLLATFFYPIPGKYLPGKVLYAAARIEFLKQSFDINRKQGTALFTLENIGMLIAAALLSSPYLLDITYSIFLKSSLYARSIIAVCLILTLIIIISFYCHKALRHRVLQHKLVLKISSLLSEMLVLPKQTLFILASNYLFMWLSFGLSGLITVLCLNLEIIQILEPFDYIMIASAFITAWLFGFLSFLTPGGLGVREASLVLFLSPYIDVEQAAIAAIISRICWTLAEFSGVLTCSLLKTPKPSVNC